MRLYFRFLLSLRMVEDMLVARSVIAWQETIRLWAEKFGRTFETKFRHRPSAEDYPKDTVTILVPFPPGGTTDLTARMLAEFMATKYGQPFVVENRPGAGGNIGTALAARAKPDGYTLTISGVGTHAANFGLYPDMPFDALKDFTHITDIARRPNAIAVNGQTEIKDLNDLLAQAKADPGSLNYASPGNGSSGHLAFEFLKQKAQVSINHIPYEGAAPQ